MYIKYLASVLIYIWQLPQHIIGLIVLLYFYLNHCSYSSYRNSKVICSYKMRGGMTLGRYIFVSESADNLTIMHEYGHVLQSQYLGPLYLFVIGIPSLIHAWLNTYIRCCWKEGYYNYYHFYTEKWANKLAGLTTENGKLKII